MAGRSTRRVSLYKPRNPMAYQLMMRAYRKRLVETKKHYHRARDRSLLRRQEQDYGDEQDGQH